MTSFVAEVVKVINLSHRRAEQEETNAAQQEGMDEHRMTPFVDQPNLARLLPVGKPSASVETVVNRR